MTKQTRFIIFIICIILFLVFTPYILLYSLGYKIDFKKMELHTTGGIYVKAWPTGAEVFIDSILGQKTGLFNDSVFMQNLTPDMHNVLVKKTGYFDYEKNIPVVGKEVTKLENVLLIKQNLAFEQLSTNVKSYSLSPNGKNLLLYKNINKKITLENLDLTNASQIIKTNYSLLNQAGEITSFIWSGDSSKVILTLKNNTKISYYYLDLSATINPSLIIFLDKNSQDINFNPQNNQQLFYLKNNQLFHYNILPNASALPALAILKTVVGYKLENNTIIWLSQDGNLFTSDFQGNLISTLSLIPYSINKVNFYEIFLANQNIFVKDNNTLLLLNPKTKTLENFYNPVKDFKISPNGQKMVYYNDYEILLYILSPETKKVFLNRFSEKITNCFWLNSDYLVFKTEDKADSGQAKIKISEIDTQGNLNIIELSTKLSEKSIINFDSNSGKLYILDNGQLSVSEKITQ